MKTKQPAKADKPLKPATSGDICPSSAWNEYILDVTQRGLLFADLLRRRSEQYYAQKAIPLPHVLKFDGDLVLDGRSLEKPVNYGLIRITPPAGVSVDQRKRPFIVVDPRAGNGPGIGGFKVDSELGVALRAGHPTYFIGFAPEPMPGQTIEDILHVEAMFVEKVIALHPEANGKPCIIGNCQAGWAVMMLAATRPELCGPIIVAGSPLSYWAGIEGQNRMRYSGGLLGGSWLTALTGDLGNGKFDGSHLVRNFESLNPARTLWSKQYDIWSTIDTDAERYLEFEKWFGTYINLNAEEMQWIVDNLFIGNRLATAEIVTRAGERIDLRNIRSPILCFCSKGDNITPPQQALGWIVDLYDKDDDILACGQTIVYAMHESVGHLGIFVSADVARKEYREFASNIDLIDVLPPGLYEAVMTPKTSETAHSELVSGDWVVRLEPRRLDDIRNIVRPNLENERRFAAARRISEINLGIYRTFFQPFIKATASPQLAGWTKKFDPSEMVFEFFSAHNPLMSQVGRLAEMVHAQRRPADSDNPFVQWQNAASSAIIAALDGWRDVRDTAAERVFLSFYGSPVLQAMLGLRAGDDNPRRRPGNEPERIAFVEERLKELQARIAVGGGVEAAIRCLGYIGMGGTGVDERVFNQLSQMRSRYGDMSLEGFKRIVREQYFLLLLDPEAALEAAPSMIPADADARKTLLDDIRSAVRAGGALNDEQARRLLQIESVFTPTPKPKKQREKMPAIPG